MKALFQALVRLVMLVVVGGMDPSGFAHAQLVPEVTLILGEDTDALDHFGTDAVLLDSTLVVGAPGRVPQAGGPYGAAYVFRLTGDGPMDGWAQEAVLTHTLSATSAGIDVGTAVAYASLPNLPGSPPDSSTEFVAAGDSHANRLNVATSGALFVFRRTPEGVWVEDVDSLIPSEAGDGDYTGSTAALVPLGGEAEGGLVAASRSDVDLVLFERAPGPTPAEGVWTEVARLPAGGHAFFAEPADLRASASEHGAFVAVPGGGGVRVYRRTGGAAGAGVWAQETVLTGSEVGPDDAFGASVAAYGAGRPGSEGVDWVLVGSPYDPPSSPDPPGGEAYLFRYTGTGPMNGWEEAAVLQASIPRRYFGLFECVLGTSADDRLVAGVQAAGAFLHLFHERTPGVWTEAGYVDVIESGAEGAARALWRGTAATMNQGATASGTQSGAVWLLDVNGILSTSTEPTVSGLRWSLSVGPNPARDRLTVRYVLTQSEAVRLAVIDARGRVVFAETVSQSAGRQVATLDVSGLPAGVYAVRIEAGSQAETRWVTVLR